MSQVEQIVPDEGNRWRCLECFAISLKDDPAFMPVVRTALMLRVASVLGIVPPDGGVLCSWRSVSERRLGVFVTVGACSVDSVSGLGEAQLSPKTPSLQSR